MAAAGIRIWDLPIRLVHWSFALLIPALWLSAENRKMELHFTLGLVMLGLVLFRLLWGLVGSSTARFSGFVRGPAAIRSYLYGLRTGTGARVIGHNPLGALSVIALIAVLAAQVGLGLFAQDTDAVNSGPLNFLVSYDTGKAMSEVHEVLFNVIVGLIVLHIGAIVYYRVVKRDNLVSPMITGRRVFDGAVEAPRMAPLWRALLCALIAAALAVWVKWGLPPWATPFPWDRPAEVMDTASYM